MFYKEVQDPLPNKDGEKLWRPTIVRTGKVIELKELSKLISTATSLTEADVTAALIILPQIMDIHLKEGNTIRLNGLGTFSVYGRTKGKGVKNKEDVRPSQFSSLVCKFTPEYTLSVNRTRSSALLNNVEFTNIAKLVGKPGSTIAPGDEDEDPTA